MGKGTLLISDKLGREDSRVKTNIFVETFENDAFKGRYLANERYTVLTIVETKDTKSPVTYSVNPEFCFKDLDSLIKILESHRNAHNVESKDERV